jgi:hypothetical protein
MQRNPEVEDFDPYGKIGIHPDPDPMPRRSMG